MSLDMSDKKDPKEESTPSKPPLEDEPEKESQTEDSSDALEDSEAEEVSQNDYENLRNLISQVKNIDRVLDVKLEFTVKLGKLNMKLRDILELNPGSIIEIEKNVDSPLDLKIGDKVLAKGEVVTIGENLGLRIVGKQP